MNPLIVASVGASTFHGYRRNNSLGWAIWWGVVASAFPVITPAVALAQGFGKPATRKNPGKSFGRRNKPRGLRAGHRRLQKVGS